MNIEFKDAFVRVGLGRSRGIGCEMCAGSNGNLWTLAGDPNASWVCRACGDDFVSQVNSGEQDFVTSGDFLFGWKVTE